MKNKVIVLFLFFLFLTLGTLFYFGYREYQNLEIDSVTFLEYDGMKDRIQVEITKRKNLFHKNPICIVKSDEETLEEEMKEGSCTFFIAKEGTYEVTLKSNGMISEKKTISKATLLPDDLVFQKETIYLAEGEAMEAPYNGKDELLNTNKDIVKIDGNKIIGVQVGETNVYTKKSSQMLKVIVTDLIQYPHWDNQKELIPCNAYTEEEAALLDQLLEERVRDAGFGTRAGAVEAARFLTLRLKYKIPYFFENGRIHESGVNYADGEGRYYHQGLYLNQNKFETLEASFSGPAIWGCPLRNWEDEPKYGYHYGEYMKNGLDCSGFVSWALKNGGFDPGDIGAGETDYPNQMTDLGEFVPITYDLLHSDKIKAGDFFNFWGHISIIIGVDEEHFYVAESLASLGGVKVVTYTRDDVGYFEYVVLMDSYYKEDGNYTPYWE